MPITATLTPRAIQNGDALSVRVEGLQRTADQTVTVHLARTDTVETGWVASLPLHTGGDGVAEANWDGVALARESAVFAVAVEIAGNRRAVNRSDVSIINPDGEIATEVQAETRRTDLEQRQRARYDVPLGDATTPDVVEHRVLCAVERLLMTTTLRLPGAVIQPVTESPDGQEQRVMLDRVLEAIGWPTRVEASAWAQHIAPSRPWTAIVCPQVWASSFDEAASLAWEVRDGLIAVLGVNRGARGRSVATVIEQRQPDDSIRHRVYVEDERYRGNLIGGFTSGEDQGHLLVQQTAINRDRLLRLCIDLYSEALADSSPDARYLRFWSVLETLSDARITSGQPVQRLDGTMWPGQHGTTSEVAPRVYQLIARLLASGNIDEATSIAPASDLYEAVRAWYARRNATGHYGRFDPNDHRQKSQPWYQWAVRTLSPASSPDEWIMTFERVASLVLQSELRTAGGSALD